MSASLHSAEYDVFRELLLSAREKSGLTQVDVAQRLQKPQSFVSKYERGERRLDFTEFMALIPVLGIDLAEFVAGYESRLASRVLLQPKM